MEMGGERKESINEIEKRVIAGVQRCGGARWGWEPWKLFGRGESERLKSHGTLKEGFSN